MYSREAVAAILVVDVTNQASFERVDSWLSTVQQHCARDCRIYIAANKIDLDVTIPIQELEKRAVAQSFPFFRTSAKQYETVAPVFEKVGSDLLRSGKAAPVGHGRQESAVVMPDNSEGNCCRNIQS
jgi:GTPase SAR1 family protein